MDKTYYSKAADNIVYYGLGYVSSQSNFNYGGITTDLLKFNFEGPVHSISGLVGYEAQGGTDDYIFGSGMGIPEGLRVPSVASGPYQISGAPTEIGNAILDFTGKLQLCQKIFPFSFLPD